jgi:2Fe-2S ferredoxin
MPKITVLPHPKICPQGAVIENAPNDVSICRILLDHGLPIEHACELSCACTTCHVKIRQGYESLAEASEEEEDKLDAAWDVSEISRLSCQALVAGEDLIVEIPQYSINHATENHS